MNPLISSTIGSISVRKSSSYAAVKPAGPAPTMMAVRSRIDQNIGGRNCMAFHHTSRFVFSGVPQGYAGTKLTKLPHNGAPCLAYTYARICGRLAIGQTAVLARDDGSKQPPRRLPACPTERQRFHSHVAHPKARSILSHWNGDSRSRPNYRCDSRNADYPGPPAHSGGLTRNRRASNGRVESIRPTDSGTVLDHSHIAAGVDRRYRHD